MPFKPEKKISQKEYQIHKKKRQEYHERIAHKIQTDSTIFKDMKDAGFTVRGIAVDGFLV